MHLRIITLKRLLYYIVCLPIYQLITSANLRSCWTLFWGWVWYWWTVGAWTCPSGSAKRPGWGRRWLAPSHPRRRTLRSLSPPSQRHQGCSPPSPEYVNPSGKNITYCGRSTYVTKITWFLVRPVFFFRSWRPFDRPITRTRSRTWFGTNVWGQIPKK